MFFQYTLFQNESAFIQHNNFYLEMFTVAVILSLWIPWVCIFNRRSNFSYVSCSFWLSLKCKMSVQERSRTVIAFMFHSASDSTLSCVMSHHYFAILTHMNEHQQCMHLMWCDCHTYFITFIKQTGVLSRKQAYMNTWQCSTQVTHKSLPPLQDWIWTLSIITQISHCFKNHI